jgi:thiosulfate dehydrogenase [quinone] large subunit
LTKWPFDGLDARRTMNRPRPRAGSAPEQRRDVGQPPRRQRRGGDDRRSEADANRLGWSLFPVRLFLGLTFVYGGFQKLSDPGFLHPGAPTYIGTQLRGFANHTPGGFLLRAFAIPHPTLSGISVALLEIAIGLLVTAGVLTRPAAAVGLALNLLLFLTNSWHTYPYFLGSDIVFVFAWLPFVIVGATRQPTLEPVLGRLAGTVPAAGGASLDRARPGRFAAPGVGEPTLTRRSAIGATLGLTALTTAVVAGVSVLLRGSYRSPQTLSGSVPRRTGAGPRRKKSSPRSRPPAAHTAPGLPAGAVRLGAASQLPAGQAATYKDPGDGQPDIIIRQSSGRLVAHSAVCTHAGCTVGYEGGQIVCPCHASVFDAQTGAVITGPATAPLPARKVIERGGEIYVLPA